jgi:uncharacterized protein (TIGR02265 family)
VGETKEEALVWGHTVEGLVRTGKPRATPKWATRLRAAGLEVDKPVAPAYTRDQWRQFIFISAEELFEGTIEERLDQLGSTFIDEYAKTFLGRAVAAVIGVIGTKRAIERMTKSLRSGNNYSETRATFTGPHRAEFWLNETLGAPTYICGALAGVLRRSGCSKVTVKTLSTDGQAATFEIEWEP